VLGADEAADPDVGKETRDVAGATTLLPRPFSKEAFPTS
jgi:hypothetical protein